MFSPTKDFLSIFYLLSIFSHLHLSDYSSDTPQGSLRIAPELDHTSVS